MERNNHVLRFVHVSKCVGPIRPPGSTRHIPKVLEPCRRIKRSARPTRASVTLCCDQFPGLYDHCNRLGRPGIIRAGPGIDWAGLEDFGQGGPKGRRANF